MSSDPTLDNVNFRNCSQYVVKIYFIKMYVGKNIEKIILKLVSFYTCKT
jgi:hypothetical protein